MLTWLHGKKEVGIENPRKNLNAEGIQGPLNQRSDFIEAKQKCKRLYDEHTAITRDGNKPIPPGQQDRLRLDQQFEGLEEYDYRLEGDSILPPGRRIHLRHHTGNPAATGSQVEAGIRGKNYPGLNSNFFFFNCSEMSFRLPEIESPGNRRRV